MRYERRKRIEIFHGFREVHDFSMGTYYGSVWMIRQVYFQTLNGVSVVLVKGNHPLLKTLLNLYELIQYSLLATSF